MFRKLRGKFVEKGIDQIWLAKKLGITQQCVSHRMTGKYPWTLTEMYAVMELIDEPPEKLHEYFPKGGKAA